MDNFEIIKKWLSVTELNDLYYPIEVSSLIKEIYDRYNYVLDKNDILDTLSNELIFKLFENLKGHRGRNRPHCLYLFSRDYIGIDQEDCIRTALKIFLNKRGYDVQEESGFIDLIAENESDCWLIEVKGKQTYEFSTLAIAQGFEQCFPLEVDDNLFNVRKTIGFGDSRNKKGHLYNFNTQKHKHIVILIPGFSPTIAWKNSRDEKIFNQIYFREVEDLKNFFNLKNTYTTFMKYLRKLNDQFDIINHYGKCDSFEWCFHMIEFRGLYNNIDFALCDSIKGNVLYL